MMNALGGFLIVSRLRQKDIGDKSLRVPVVEGEPTRPEKARAFSRPPHSGGRL